MKKISKRKYYKKHTCDIAFDISQSNYWRQQLYESDYNHKFLINRDSKMHISKYLHKILIGHNLNFYISKVLERLEHFDEGCIIFKFESVEFPDIKEYSGNYFGDHQNILKGENDDKK